MRDLDWSVSQSVTSPGPSSGPRVSLMLARFIRCSTRSSPKLAFLANDAYRPIFGTKHPHTLGRRSKPFGRRSATSSCW
jgi:hypothetical protein